MKVYIYPADVTGCGYYRLIWVGQFLRSQGHDINLVHPKHHGRFQGIKSLEDENVLEDINHPKDADVIVMQRVSSIKMISGIKIMRSRGIAVVLDIDDDMRAIHPSNPAFIALNPSTKGQQADYSWSNADKVYAAATWVTCSTDALLRRYARREPGTNTYHGTVLRNVVPKVMTEIQPRPTLNVIGWGGTILSHPNDLQVCGPAMAQIQRAGYTFRVVGPGYGIKKALLLDQPPEATGPVELQHWPHHLSRLSVGIAPLAQTRFNEAKSWLKMLEYASLGVPVVASPTREYEALHKLGVGLLAKDPRQWVKQCRRLLDDASFREEMSIAGRQAVIDAQLTVEAQAWRWLEVWTKAFQLERGPLGLKPAATTVQAPG